jgi:hypothetical protein
MHHRIVDVIIAVRCSYAGFLAPPPRFNATGKHQLPRPGSLSCRCGRLGWLAGRAGLGMPGVQTLQQVVGGELDVLVPPLGSPVLAGDDSHAVQTTEVAIDKRVPDSASPAASRPAA